MTKNSLKIFLAVGIIYLFSAQPAFAQSLEDFLSASFLSASMVTGFLDVIMLFILAAGIAFATIRHFKQGGRQGLAIAPSKPISIILSAAATLCLLITLFIPFVFYIDFLKGQGYLDFFWLTGFDHKGWRAFIPIIAFAVTFVIRIIPPLAAYRHLADGIAFVAFAACLFRSVVAWFIWLIWQVFDGHYIYLGLPNIGVIFVIVAPVLLFIAHNKEKR